MVINGFCTNRTVDSSFIKPEEPASLVASTVISLVTDAWLALSNVAVNVPVKVSPARIVESISPLRLEPAMLWVLSVIVIMVASEAAVLVILTWYMIVAGKSPGVVPGYSSVSVKVKSPLASLSF